MLNTQGGYKYFVIFVHEGSRYVLTYALAKKVQVPECVKRAAKWFRNQKHSGKVNEFRSGGGGEYMSKSLHQWLENEGIQLSLSTTRTPEQNGISERHIRTIMDKVRSMLKYANRKVGYWIHAMKTAFYLHNVTSHAATRMNVTPSEALKGVVPGVANLVPWGCVGVLPVDKEVRPAGGMGNNSFEKN
jgi:transposase InsO family protein